jgi:micrococcal nuclease
MYQYKAKVVRVVDGDTIDCIVDLGFGIMNGNEGSPVRFRLAGINAPETRLGKNTDEAEKQRGLQAKAWLASLIEGHWVEIHTEKDDKGKFGRYLAYVIFADTNLNEAMVEEGLAEFAEY